MENAVLFEQESSRVRVRNLLTDGGVTQTELHTVLEALDVSETSALCVPCKIYNGLSNYVD